VDLFERLKGVASQVGELIADDVGAHVELGAALLERGDLDGAIHELSQALARRRDHARALYLHGLAHLRREGPGDLAQARQSLTQATQVREGFGEALLALGELEEQAGDEQAAAEGYRRALPVIDDDALRVEVERRLGALYLRTGRVDKAVRELRKAVSADPEDAEAQGLLGQALVQRARLKGEPQGGPTYEAARLCLTRAARAERPSPIVLAELGTLLLQVGQIEDSEKALRRALQVDPGCVPALLGSGAWRLHQGDVAGAYEQALRAAAGGTDAGGAELHLLLARCHGRSGSPERALLAYEEALKHLHPGGPGAPPGRAREVLDEALHLALRHGLFAQAVRLGALPEVAETPDGLAARAQDPALPLAEAEALLGRALSLAAEGGETVEVRLCEARLLRKKGAPAGAVAQALRRASALAPADSRPLAELSALYKDARARLPGETYGLLQAAHRHLLRTPELMSHGPEAAALLSTLDRPLLLCVMGEFNAGKSTFVNALLGEEVAPMGILPTTATINVLKYGQRRGGRVVYRDDTSREVGWDEVPALLKAVDEEEARRIRLVEVLYPLEVLQRVNVVDTPGLNSIQPEHEAVARGFIAEADAVVWLFSVDQAGKASEREALEQIRKEGKRALGVVNKIDRLGDAAGTLDVNAEVEGAPIFAHLRESLSDLLEAVVPFSARDALLGRKGEDAERVARSNLSGLMAVLEERFFARSQAIKRASARTRLVALLSRARGEAEALLDSQGRRLEELRQAVRLCQADAALFAREFIPAERRRLIAETDGVHKVAARETLDFVRPRRWPFGQNQAAPADRDFLLVLLDEQIGALLAASRARVVEALGERDEDRLLLLDEQVYGHYRAFSRGYLQGGKVEDFFIRVLPRLELTEAAIGRALERDGPMAIDILEGELLSPLRRFSEVRFRSLQQGLARQVAEEEMRRLDLEERVITPLGALLQALQELPEGK
jgi:tetratricopeptide (TPR) repeat protein/GTPase SAR1 family protein